MSEASRAEARRPDSTPARPAVTRRVPTAAGLALIRRLIAVAAVVALLAVPYFSSLRVYFRQQAEAAELRTQIAQRQAEIGTLQDEIKRWQDPNFVRAQARSRLGWVVPGEIGYRVIGPDGKPLGGGAEIESESPLPSNEHRTVWWERLMGSVRTADNPVPQGSAKPTTPQATITPPSTVSPSASPKTVQPTAKPSR